MIFLTILSNIILPVFIIIGFGYAIQRFVTVDVRSLSRVAFYILSPCLIFSSLTDSTLSGTDFWQIVSFVLLTTLAMWLLSWGITRLLRFSQAMESAFLLSTLFINAGNYGLAVNLFAFGQTGLERALIFFATSSLLTNTLGIYLASRGRTGVADSVRNIFKVPMIYAVVLALIINVAHLTAPDPLFKALDIAGNAAIPVMLLLLGMQLSQTSVGREMKRISLATVVRLIVAAGVAMLLATLLGLRGVTRQACLVEASMPTAVTTTVLAVEFDAKPDFVTAVVFASTLASIVTLTALLSLII